VNPVKKIRILQGIRQGKIGGGESYLLSLVEQLDRDRFEPVVLSFTDGPMMERLKQLDIKAHVIHTEKPFDFRIWKRVDKLVEDEDIDIVHAHGTRAMSNLFSTAKSRQLPLLYTCHGWSFHIGQNPVIKALRIKSEKYLTSKADINICGAKTNRDEARNVFGKFDAEIIYNSINPAKFNPYGTYKNVREELGVSKDDILIGFIARFTLQKQPLKMIESFAKVCKQVPNAKLLMVGDGELKSEAVKLVAQLKLEDKVVMQSFRQDVPDLLAGLDVFVLPSLWEGFSIALLEAMSIGNAVVATSVNGTLELIENNKNGLLVDVAKLENELPEALLKLCFDKNLRNHLRKNAIESVYNKYNVQTMVDKNQLIYHKLALKENHPMVIPEAYWQNAYKQSV